MQGEGGRVGGNMYQKGKDDLAESRDHTITDFLVS